ncbi:MAG: TonB-dependent receptor [Pseudomonadota bacterium]
MKKTLLAFTSLLSLLTTHNSIAASAAQNKNSNQNTSVKSGADDEQYQLFDTDVFSLSKKNEDAFDAASSIYVLSSEDIRRSGATSIPEALRLVPGIQVARIDGNKWAISARGFNAQFSNKLLIMIDGRTVYTPVFSGAFWDVQDYVLEDVEKIEVIRGSGGAIWGANAVNGVINIITKNAVDTQGGYVSGIVGNQDRAIAEVRYGGRTESLNHYRVYAKHVDRDQLNKLNTDTGNDDGYQQSQAGFRYDIRSIKDSTIAVHGDVRSGKAENYFPLSSVSPVRTDKNSTGGNLVVNWDKTISKKSSFTLQTYLDYDQFDTGILSRAGRTADIDFQHFYDFNRQNQFVWGLGYRLLQDKIGESALNNNVVPLNYTLREKNDEIFNAFLQDKIGLIADTLYLTIGSKFEINDYTGFEFQPSAKLTLYPSRNQTVWASVSRAVRTPTRGEESIEIRTPGGTLVQAGDAQYESEKVLAYELGYRIKPTRTSLIDIATFYNDYDDLRSFNSKNGFSATTTNFGQGRSYGTEITAKWQAMDDWRLEAGYDFLRLDLKNDSPSTESRVFPLYFAEKQSPKNQFRLRSNYNITSKIEFDNILYYVNAISDSRGVSDTTGVKAYARIDTRLGYLFNSNLNFSVGIQNLADKRHQEFDKGLFANETEVGRTIYFKTAIKFW